MRIYGDGGNFEGFEYFFCMLDRCCGVGYVCRVQYGTGTGKVLAQIP